jgi:phosphate-selective porin OprO/OprP
MRKVGRLVLHVVLAGLISGTLQTALAEGTAPRGQTVEERLEALEQRQKILERNRELEKEAEQEKAKSTVVAGAGKEGFVLKSADGNFQLKVGGFVHADGRFFLDDDLKPATNTFLIRRAFVNFESAVYKNFVFRIQPDFGGGKTILQDAYLDARFAPAFQLLVGKTKVPFLLERLQKATDRRFVELAFPNSLSPNRDIGTYLHGDLFKGAVTYALGVFNGLPDGDTSDGDFNDDKDGAARLFVHPFRNTEIEPLHGLGLGVAATYGNQEGKVDTSKKSFTSNLPSYKTSGQQTFFSYRDQTGEPTKDFSVDNNVIADGNRTRISPQAYYYWGPFGLLGEYVQTRQEVRRGNNAAKLTNSAWQAAGYYVLTGEKNSFKHISPSKPFDLGKGQWGALELVARYSELRVDAGAFPTFADPAKSANRAKAWAAGFNWYLNRNVKLAANYEQTRFKGGGSGNGDREAEKVILSRVEVAY